VYLRDPQVEERRTAMDKLTDDELRSRLSFDYQTVMLMSCPLMMVEAYRNLDDLLARRNLITSPEQGHLAVHYRVKYNLKTLVGRGLYSNSTTVRFDLFADNNYPESEPPCFVIDSQLPWSPHFHSQLAVCTGEIWEEADGNMLLGELMVHVARLLNFDEPPNSTVEEGYQPDAARYWLNELGRRPISRLVYPQLPQRVPPLAIEAAPPVSAFITKEIIEPAAPAMTPPNTTRTATSVTTETPLITFRQS
jgi:hypothetical protein